MGLSHFKTFSHFSQVFNNWIGVKDEVLSSVMELIEMLQNASLMIDDIEDASELRRGLPCAHLVYGVPSTINSANYYYFLALQKLVQISPPEKLPELMAIFLGGVLRLHEVSQRRSESASRTKV